MDDRSSLGYKACQTMKTKRIQSLLVCTLGLTGILLGSAPAHSAVIATDSFESYEPGTGGSLLGQDGETGWAGPWLPGTGNTANVIDTSAEPLLFIPDVGPTISGHDRAVEVFGTVNVVTAARELQTPWTETFYAAYLMRTTGGTWGGNNTFSIHMADTASNTSSLNFGIRAAPDGESQSNHFMVRTATGGPVAGAAAGGFLEPGTTYFLIARLSQLDADDNPTGTYDRIELWINPGPDSPGDLPNGDARLQMSPGTGLAAISHLLVRAAALQGDDIIEFDEVILSTEWPFLATDAPRIVNVSPAHRAMFVNPAAGLQFEIVSDSAVARETIRLILNGTDVSESLVVSGTETAWTVSYPALEAGRLYRAEITASSSEGDARMVLQFDTFSETLLMIEAEDFNFNRGQFFDNPVFCNDIGGGVPNCYFDRVGVQGVDAFKGGASGNVPIENLYRYGPGAEREEQVDTNVSGDVLRPRYAQAPGGASGPIQDFDVTALASGDWLNYTRTFPEGVYALYLRARSSAVQQVQLNLVTNPTMESQTTSPVGLFQVPNTGGAYSYIPLTDAQGNIIPLGLAGVQTLNLNTSEANNNLQINFLILVPSDAEPLPAFVAAVLPANNAVNVHPTAAIRVEIVNAATTVNAESITMFLDDSDITESLTVTSTATGAVAVYEPGLLLPGQHEVSLSFIDSAEDTITQFWTFSVMDLPVLPAAWAAPIGSGTTPGFMVRSAQTLDPGVRATLAENLTTVENQLAIPPLVQVDFTGTDTPQVINYNETEAKGSQGYFNDARGYPDRGAREAGLISPDDDDWFSVEIRFYLQLQPGLVQLGVNANDSFSLRAGRSGEGLENFPLLLGQRPGAGGATEETPQFPCDFIVTHAGVYAFRLVWAEYVGSASVELHVKDDEGVTHLVNDQGSPLAAFRTRTQEPPEPDVRLVIVGDATGITISWPGAGTLESAPTVTGPWEAESGAVSPYQLNPDDTRFYRVAE
jgi:hypothetical protein